MTVRSPAIRADTRPAGPGRLLDVYVACVIAAGALVVLRAGSQLPRTPKPFECLLFAACALLTGSFTLKIAAIPSRVSVGDTFFITSALLFGPAPSAVVTALASALMSARRRHPLYKIAFNAAGPGLSVWVAAELFFAVARIPPLILQHAPIDTVLVPLIALTAVYFVLNTGLTAGAVALQLRESPFSVWRRHFLFIGVGYGAAASVSLCLTLIVDTVGFSAIVIVFPLLIVLHLTLRSSFGRLEDATRHVAELDRLYVSTVETLAMAIDAKDDVTHSHVRRVQTYALGLARALGIGDEPTLKAIEAAALLHDTGKLAVPEHILNKPGKLTPAEFEQMKLHVDVGADILSGIDFPFPVVPIVRCHHENWDGSGYPRGTSGEEIPIGARILSVVDCFDALTSDRPYRRKMTTDAALGILRERRGTMYDPRVVDRFIDIHEELAAMPLIAPTLEHAALQQISQAAASVEPLASAASSPPDETTAAFAALARLAPSSSLSDVLTLASSLLRNDESLVTTAWFVYDSSADRLLAMHVTGPAAPSIAGTWISLGERLSGWVAAQRRPALNSDPALDLGDSACRTALPLRSCLSVPLTSSSSLAGVLTTYSPDERAFTDDDLRRLQAIAPHAAAAILAGANRAAPIVSTSLDAAPAKAAAPALTVH